MSFGNISSTPTRDVQFAKDLFSSIASVGVDGAHVQQLAKALSNIPAYELSQGERQSLLNVADRLVSDGQISCRELKCLTSLINSYSNNHCTFQYSLGEIIDAVFGDKNIGGPLGELVAGGTAPVGHHTAECFREGVLNALEGAEDNTWSGALEGAIENADLSNVNASERSKLGGMVMMASADGKINWAEAKAILNKLNQFQAPDCQCPCPHPKPSPESTEWSVEMNGSTATIDLGEYTLDINEKHSEFILTNKETGESSRIWGDPHFDMDNDGKTDVDFWGTMTMNLENGTKITIQTTPWKGNENMTVSSSLTITQGDKAIEVTGMDQNNIGDMEITQSNNGYALDAFTGDGLDIYENDGKWMVLDGFEMREVTQDDMNTTKGDNSNFDLIDGLESMNLFSMSLFTFSASLLFGMAFGSER